MKQNTSARLVTFLVSLVAVVWAPGSAPAAYVLSAEEALIADYMVNDAGQMRPSMQLDPILARLARERAQDLAARNYFAHVNPDGFGPNALVRDAGYVLPAWWGTAATDNYIESIAAGRNTAAAAWTDWMNSPSHRTHILGTDVFYQNQTSYGVGYAYSASSTYRHYWAILTAPPNAAAGNAALFMVQSVPGTMTPGAPTAVSVEMLNTGTNTWTQAGGYRLGSQAPAGNWAWGLSEVNLPGDVAPGSAVTFNFVVAAPGTVGTTNFQWQMQKDGVGAFGEPTPLRPISVGYPAPYVAPPVRYSSSRSSSSKKESDQKKSKKSKKKKKKKKKK